MNSLVSEDIDVEYRYSGREEWALVITHYIISLTPR